jgi:hypothetical protein
MRPPILASAVLLLLVTVPAQGSGINAFWNNCGTSGASMRTFACNTNVGTNDIVASFEIDNDLADLTGAIGVIDLCLGGVTLAPWWQYNAGSCREGALTAVAVDVGGPSTCSDVWQGQAGTTLSYQVGYSGWDSARIVVWTLLGQPLPASLGTEYHAFTVRIRNNDTVGGCAGCSYPACIVLNEIRLTTANSGDLVLVNALNSNYLMWQNYVLNCPFIVPVQNRTWGQLKSSYR